MTAVNPFDLSGRLALVTGASRGIGEAIARGLAAAGARVIVASRKLEGCETVAASIRRAGGQAEARACHIGEMAQISALFAGIATDHGRLDILVNNAGTNPYFGPIVDTPPEAFQKTIDVNLRGYFYCSSEGVKLMRRNGGGSIINVASINGVQPGPKQGIYSITKAGVINMTKAFAAECAEDGIRVNALLPVLTDTKLAAALVHDEAMLAPMLPRLPMKRAAQPDEMAGLVVYLASSAASYTTGACINVDGGYLAD